MSISKKNGNKKMELKEIIMYVVITAACVAPLVWFWRAANKNSRLALKSLRKLLGTKPQVYDVWQGRGIAKGAKSEKVVFINLDPAADIKECTLQSKITDCQITVNGKKENSGKKTIDQSTTTEISLHVTTADGLKHRLSFFDLEADGPFQAAYSFQLAKKWRKMLLGEAPDRVV